MYQFKCISINVNGIAEKQKRNLIFDYIRHVHADIYCLQETHNDHKINEDQWEKEWGGQCIWSTGSNRSRGVAIMLPPGSNLSFSNIRKDNNGRIVAATLEDADSDTRVNIINIYAPNVPRERKEFYDKLWQYKPGDVNIVLTGDFNCVAEPDIDKYGGNHTSGTTGIEELTQFLNDHNLVDIWRVKHPNDRIYTWNSKDFSQRSRLDRWYVREGSEGYSTIRACPHSDHSAIELTLKTSQGSKRGKGTWKLNQQILDDPSFQRDIKEFHRFWKGKQQEFESMQDWWDRAKNHYKAIAITHAVRRSRNRDREFKELNDRLTNLQQQSIPDVDMIARTKERLTELETKKIAGVKIRSRATWMEDGEKPTKYFFGLEKRKQDRARITKLHTDQGEIIADNEILEEARKFYQELYKQEPGDTNSQQELLDSLDNRLTAEMKATCEGPVTKLELTAALKKMHSNKSPGPDGLTTEFYRIFWNELVDDIVGLFNNNFLMEAMSPSQRESLLRLLHKKNEREFLKNWRPISLLNTDYKILATLLANRLRTTLPDVIHEDQTCGIPGRTIFDTVLRLRDITHEATAKGQNLILISLDQEKAFDRVNREYMHKILEKLNYGPTFIQWLKTLYHGANCRIINNGWLSDPVFLTRGVRQGCPLSPLLYTIVVETLTNAIRKHSGIEGVHVPGNQKRSKVSAYADDSTLTLKDDLSVTRAFDVIYKFERASGSKLNMSKTEGVYVGQQAGRDHGPVPIKWNTDGIKILGAKIGNDLEQDWTAPIEKVEKTLKRWQDRTLSVKGKTVILQTYAIATITYLASIFTIPERYINRLHKAIFSFLWNQKNELVARATCHLPLCQGGLGIPDIHTTRIMATLKWIKLLTNKEAQSIWFDYGRYWTGQAMGCVKPEWQWLRSNIGPHGEPNKAPSWYKAIIDFVHEHKDTLSRVTDNELTLRTIKQLIQEPHEPRCIAVWRRTTRAKQPFQWNTLWKSKCDNIAKEFVWKLTHRVLTTKAYLRTWGMRVNPECPFCKHNEDVHHALIHCQRAQNTWRALKPLIAAVAGQDVPITIETMVFRKGLPTTEPAQGLCFYIISTAATKIWKTRNKKIYDAQYNPGEVHKDVIHIMKQRIRIDFLIQPQRIEQFWNHKGIIVDIRNGQLQFNV